MGFKRNHISMNLNDYSVAILGEAGIGKTTLMVDVCEKLFGEDGYVIFNCGKEQGIDAIENATYEDIPDYKAWDTVTKDIIKNKTTDYPNLKVIVLDTLDQLIDLAVPETVRRWNNENASNPKFVNAKTINQTWGGFGKGEDFNDALILDRIFKLKQVGVTCWYTGHVKTRDIVDPVTMETFTRLTTDMAQRDFNVFKNKMHVVGIACVDRSIETEGTGRKNVVTRKEITVNKVKSETRKIVFRDDNYSIDSKSRFAGIVNEIPLDADAFIKALQDAIKSSRDRKGTSTANNTDTEVETKVEKVTEEAVATPTPVEETAPEVDVDDTSLDEEAEASADIFDDEDATESEYPENLKEVVKGMIRAADPDRKKEVQAYVSTTYGSFSKTDEEGLKHVYDMLK